MAIPVIMPRQGQSVERCIIAEWKKKVGDPVKTGDVLFSYETDKSTFEEEAKADGTLLAVFFQADDEVPCLTTVAVIGNPGESCEEFRPSACEAAKAAPEKAPAMETAPFARAEGISPRARAVAQALRVDASKAEPTGPHKRVIERDVIAFARESRTDSGPDYDEIRMPNLRRVIARTMHESLAETAQLTYNTSFDATQILTLREQIKAAPAEAEMPKSTINDMILFAVSRALTKYESLNAHCLGDKMRCYRHAHLGIAVDTPRGLLVPTLFNADEKSLYEIAAESKALIKAAKEGSIHPDLLRGGTFTVSNVGVYGVESFTPIINPPQVALLGVCCITERVRTVNGRITAYPAMGLSLTCDHRAVDGAPASRFLKDLVTMLEHFDLTRIG